MDHHYETPEAILHKLISYLSDFKNDKKLIKLSLPNYFTSEAEIYPLIRINVNEAAISKALILDEESAKVIVYDPHPHLAIFQRAQERWQLDLFLYQCPSCFGTGILFDDSPCDVCGGTGWGELGLTKIGRL